MLLEHTAVVAVVAVGAQNFAVATLAGGVHFAMAEGGYHTLVGGHGCGCPDR